MARAWLGAAVIALGVAPAAAQPLPRPLPPGEVCGEAKLFGTALPPRRDEGGCGIAAPVSLSRAAGVALEPPATVACETARALAGWLAAGAASFAALGGRLEAVTVVDAYSCRGRNRRERAVLSEHAFGRAIDIAGFRLGDGTTVTVLDGWTAPRWSRTLRALHATACGSFGTVLGPDANPLHAGHLHLDVEERRSGAYCR